MRGDRSDVSDAFVKHINYRNNLVPDRNTHIQILDRFQDEVSTTWYALLKSQVAVCTGYTSTLRVASTTHGSRSSRL